MKIYLWEYAVSPHLGNILKGMAALGYQTCYVVHSETYASREAEGWLRPDFPGVEILQPRDPNHVDNIIALSSPDDIHICVGIRANDHVRTAAAALRANDRRFLVFMETIDERNLLSKLKRPLYRKLFLQNRHQLEGILAVGASTMDWVAARGVPASQIFDFAYFLSAPIPVNAPPCPSSGVRLLFVGGLIARKRVHLIIEALRSLPNNITLSIVGDGPLRTKLAQLAEACAPGRVNFYGTHPMSEIAGFMASADCLVLPSDHDGWGAVVSEAMLAGTPVVCSDQCGASVAVRAAGRGQVFEAFAHNACTKALCAQVSDGMVTTKDRAKLANWAKCLAEPAGAAYLDRIIAHLRRGAPRPQPPWEQAGLWNSPTKTDV
jgi:glycosyltransferase involved in cell wall biosynthesis